MDASSEQRSPTTGNVTVMSESAANQYLEQEVLSASPAKLRWLLVEKGVKLCQVITELWKAEETALANQWTLRLREILNELLSGVHGSDAVAKQVSDLAIYHIQLLTEAELGCDLRRMAQLQELLEIDAETWLQVHMKLTAAPSHAIPPPPLGGLWSSSVGTETSLCIDA